MRKVLLLLAIGLPQRLKRLVYRRLLGWTIGQRVRIGYSYLEAKDVRLADDVRIGHFNIMRGLKHFSVGKGTYIANFNHIFGATFPDWASELVIGKGVMFMSRHFVDVGGTVVIGDEVVVGGRDTQFWSHTLTLVDNQPSLQPTSLRVGKEVYIGARATLVSCDVPDGAVVGAGSVVTKSFPAESARLLIAGNPATVRKRYSSPDDKDS